MKSVKLQDFNVLVVHSGDTPNKRTLQQVKLLKSRIAENGSLKINIKYEPFNSGKIKGKSFEEVQVFYDEVSSLDNDRFMRLPVSEV